MIKKWICKVIDEHLIEEAQKDAWGLGHNLRNNRTDIATLEKRSIQFFDRIEALTKHLGMKFVYKPGNPERWKLRRR